MPEGRGVSTEERGVSTEGRGGSAPVAEGAHPGAEERVGLEQVDDADGVLVARGHVAHAVVEPLRVVKDGVVGSKTVW